MENTLGDILSEKEPEAVAVKAVEPEPEQAPVQATEITGEQAAPPAVPQEDPNEKHRKGLESAALAERRRRQEIEAEFAAFRAKYETKPEPEPGAPDPTQYTDTAAYLRDVARYEANQAFNERQQQHEAQRRQAAERAELDEIGRRADAVIAQGQAKYADFDAAINSGLAPFLNPSMQQALVLSESGAEVAYFLAKNPAEAARVSAMKPMQMAVEIGRLESKVQAPAKAAIPQTLTQARDTRGQFVPNSYTGPTPLDDIFKRK